MKVYVIGGGPAGMMSAIVARRQGYPVTLLERNEKTGKKLFITGKGRCNLTNASPVQNLIENTVRNGKFMYGAFRSFDSEKCMRFFEELGVPLKVERGNRVFPVSDKSSDVIAALNKEMKKSGVDVRLNERVLSLTSADGKVVRIVTEKNEYSDVGYVVVATGGITYPSTGSTGDGYLFANALGHSVIDAVPSLCDIRLRTPQPSLQGVSLKNVACSIESGGKEICSEFGEMLFTDKGVGGPCVLSLSAKICRMNVAGMVFCIDLKPALDEETLNKRILRDFDEANNKNKAIKNVLTELMPKSLIPVVLSQSGIQPEKSCNAISKEERRRLVSTVKKMTFPILGCEKERAVITAGGVNTVEISPKTMRSKLIRNLAFAGEVLDVDAMTGGYNLQIAFATGYIAGSNVTIENEKGENEQ